MSQRGFSLFQQNKTLKKKRQLKNSTIAKMRLPDIGIPAFLAPQTWAPMYDECYSCRSAQYDHSYSSWINNYPNKCLNNYSNYQILEKASQKINQFSSKQAKYSCQTLMGFTSINSVANKKDTVGSKKIDKKPVTTPAKKESSSQSISLYDFKEKQTNASLSADTDNETTIPNTAPISNTNTISKAEPVIISDTEKLEIQLSESKPDPEIDIHTFAHLSVFLSKKDSLTLAARAHFVPPFYLFGNDYPVKKYFKYVQRHNIHVPFVNYVPQTGLSPASYTPPMASHIPLKSPSPSLSSRKAPSSSSSLSFIDPVFERQLKAAATRHKHRRTIPTTVARKIEAERVKYQVCKQKQKIRNWSQYKYSQEESDGEDDYDDEDPNIERLEASKSLRAIKSRLKSVKLAKAADLRKMVLHKNVMISCKNELELCELF